MDSIPEEVTELFQFTWSHQLQHVPGVDSASNRNV
jgi:hypothetical protein